MASMILILVSRPLLSTIVIGIVTLVILDARC
jgi:hypothetical protein